MGPFVVFIVMGVRECVYCRRPEAPPRTSPSVPCVLQKRGMKQLLLGVQGVPEGFEGLLGGRPGGLGWPVRPGGTRVQMGEKRG